MTKPFEIARRSFVFGASLAGLAAQVLAAQVLLANHVSAHSDFPTKPITMYISFPLEGSSGKVGLLLGPKMQEKLGQPINFKWGAGDDLFVF